MKITVTAANHQQYRALGMVDVTFKRTETQSTVVTMTKDELLDLGCEIEATACSDLFAGYEEPDDFGMYGPSGNREVANMIDTLVAAIKNGLPEEEAQSYLDTERDRIAGNHSEVWDTDVREEIADTLAPVWAEAFGSYDLDR